MTIPPFSGPTILALAAFFIAPSLALSAEVKWIESPDGNHTDLQADGLNVVRYCHEPVDDSTPERREQTYKVFHHVYDAGGENFITKGPGGKFTHHRGIFFGFSKITYKGADGEDHAVDIWHCKGDTCQTHEEVIEQTATPDMATQKLAIAWRGDGGEVFIEEERTLTFRDAHGGLQIDFTSTLSTPLERVHLDGDPQHAGFQFRASNEVAESTAKQTYYIRPGTGKAKPGETINVKGKSKDVVDGLSNLPWKAMSFVTGGERYTAVYIDHPDNPKPSWYSERDYGRFGSFFVTDVTPDKPVTVRYRLVIVEGELEPAQIDKIAAAAL